MEYLWFWHIAIVIWIYMMAVNYLKEIWTTALKMFFEEGKQRQLQEGLEIYLACLLRNLAAHQSLFYTSGSE